MFVRRTFINNMKVELHCHTSRYSKCSVNTPEEMLTRLIELGYDAVFLTEHDKLWPDGELEKLREKFPQIKIFPGMELTFHASEDVIEDQKKSDDGREYKSFAHILVLGTADPAFLAMSDPAEAIALAEELNCLTVLAHPFRFSLGDWPVRDECDTKKLPDTMEYFSPNVNASQAELSRKRANQLELRLVNSGDEHAESFADKFWIETNRPFKTPAELRKIILDGDYKNRPCC